MAIKIQKVAYRRNGLSAEGFYLIHFRDGKIPLVGIVFDSSRREIGAGECRVAVFDEKSVAPAQYRGDYYEPFLLAALKPYDTCAIF